MSYVSVSKLFPPFHYCILFVTNANFQHWKSLSSIPARKLCLCHYLCTAHTKLRCKHPTAAFFLLAALFSRFFCSISRCVCVFFSFVSIFGVLSASSLPKTVRNMSLVSKQEKLLNYDSYFESVSAHDFWCKEDFFLLLLLLLLFFYYTPHNYILEF